MRSRSIRIALTLIALGGLVSCKPTEGNYRKAYEAAVEKRTKADPDADLIYGGHRPASPLGAIEEQIGQETFYTLRVQVNVVEGEGQGNPYRVAVAFFRMSANAVSDASRLRAAGVGEAGVVTSGDEKYFVTVASAPTLKEAAAQASAYAAGHPDTPYIGLGHSSPLILISPR